MIPIIYPYKMGSASAKALATALSTKRVKPDGRYRPKDGHLIITWGTTQIPNWLPEIEEMDRWLNGIGSVAVASRKDIAFLYMREAGVQVPEFTDALEEAQEWLRNGSMVVCRTMLRAAGGRGIVLTDNLDALPAAPLYVKYVKKMAEYRVHVFMGGVLDVQQKKKVRDTEDVNYRIRNHANGWIYARNDVQIPADVIEQAIAAVDALGLDFGAVDVIWNNHYQKAYVLEVNTAPGLEGTTLTKYVEAITDHCRSGVLTSAGPLVLQ